MTKKPEEAIAKARELPDAMQDIAAEELLRRVSILAADELHVIDSARRAAAEGDVQSLDDWRHDMGLTA